MDGGTVYNVNLVSAVNKCLEIVDHPSKIIMDFAVCSSTSLGQMDETSNTMGNFMRYREIKKFDHALDDILEF